MMVEFREFVVC